MEPTGTKATVKVNSRYLPKLIVDYMEVVWISEKRRSANKDGLQNTLSTGDNQDGKRNSDHTERTKMPAHVNVSPSTSFSQHASGSSAVSSASGAVAKQQSMVSTVAPYEKRSKRS